jgi:acetate kinase
MGFSPLEGVPMATRSGSIDAEIVLHLLRRRWASAAQVEEALEHGSGLLGLSGISSRVEELEASDQPQAAFALDVFSYRVSAAVAACAVALGGLDALVFTAGVGEGSPSIRAAICARLAFLGIVLDERSNRTAVPDAEIAPPDAPVRVSVIAAREDLVAARATRRLLDL